MACSNWGIFSFFSRSAARKCRAMPERRAASCGSVRMSSGITKRSRDCAAESERNDFKTNQPWTTESPKRGTQPATTASIDSRIVSGFAFQRSSMKFRGNLARVRMGMDDPVLIRRFTMLTFPRHGQRFDQPRNIADSSTRMPNIDMIPATGSANERGRSSR